MTAHHMIFQIDADAPQQDVLRALTTEDGITGWWTDRAIVPGEAGGTLLLTFPLMPEPWQLRLAERSAGCVEWRVGDFPPAWAGTRIVWRLSPVPDGPGTRIVLQHRDWDESAPTVGTVTVRWVQVLHALRRYVESGVPSPVYVNTASG